MGCSTKGLRTHYVCRQEHWLRDRIDGKNQRSLTRTTPILLGLLLGKLIIGYLIIMFSVRIRALFWNHFQTSLKFCPFLSTRLYFKMGKKLWRYCSIMSKQVSITFLSLWIQTQTVTQTVRLLRRTKSNSTEWWSATTHAGCLVSWRCVSLNR